MQQSYIQTFFAVVCKYDLIPTYIYFLLCVHLSYETELFLGILRIIMTLILELLYLLLFL